MTECSSPLVHVSTAALNIPERIVKSRQRIIMHAAVYGNFAVSAPHREAIEHFLQKEDVTLDILAIPFDKGLVWFEEFCAMLRQDFPEEELAEHFTDSWRYLNDLSVRENVRVHEVRQLPAAPMLFFDDTLLVGSYLHSRITAPEGLWTECQIDGKRMFSLLDTTGRDLREKSATPYDFAVFRYLEDAYKAAEGQLLCLL